MAAEYYYMIDGKPTGPLTVAKLRQAIEARKLPPSIPVWTDGMNGWHPAASIAEILPPAPKRMAEVSASIPKDASAKIVSGAPSNGSARQPINNAPEPVAGVEFFDEIPVAVSPPPIPTAMRIEPSLEFVDSPQTAVPGTVGIVKPKDYLAIIRRGTSYRALRRVIEVCYGIALFLAGATMLVNILLGFAMVISDEGPNKNGVVWILGSIIGGVLAIGLTIAAEQSALLLIDIADATLHEHSRLRNQVGGEHAP